MSLKKYRIDNNDILYLFIHRYNTFHCFYLVESDKFPA